MPCISSGVSLALSSLSLSVPEGDSGTTTLPICIHLQDFSGGLQRDVSLLLTTSFGSAGMLSFNIVSRWSCCLNQHSDVCMIHICHGYLTLKVSVIERIMIIADARDFVVLTDEPFTVLSTTPLNQDVCFELSIIGDEIREGDETFTVSVAVGNSNDFIVGSNTATVTIQEDSDGMKNRLLNVADITVLAGTSIYRFY